MTRREFTVALPFGVGLAALATPATKMRIALSCGSIGIKATQEQAVDYAIGFGFEAVEADAGWLTRAPQASVDALLSKMKDKGLAWAQAGLPVEFRKGEDEFRAGLKTLPATAQALQRAGVTRVSTWLMPVHATLTYRENFRQHATRLREVARILEASGCRLGLEYVGPKTLWSSARYPFIHTMREMKELIAETGQSNIGFVLDSWHWFTAGETADDLKTLTNRDVVSVDLNDAPRGLALDQQQDGQRELPGATGVIDVAAFLRALHAIGCDAPARCEPFNAAVRAMPPEQALTATITSLRKVFASAAA